MKQSGEAAKKAIALSSPNSTNRDRTLIPTLYQPRSRSHPKTLPSAIAPNGFQLN